MILEKVINTKVDITDPILIYSSDINSVIIDKLKQRFEGKCYASCLILEVLEIIKKSNITFSREKQDSSASCSVMFRVKGIILKQNEIIHNCIVQKIHKEGHIICKNNHMAVYIKYSKPLQTIKEGQIIPAITGLVRYNLFRPAISVNALPFIPVFKKDVIYELLVDESDEITALIKKSDEEKKLNEKIDKKVLSFFTELLYPYKTTKYLDNHLKSNKKSSLVEFKKISSMKKGTTIHISQADYIPYSDSCVILYKEVGLKNILGNREIQKLDNTKTQDGGLFLVENYVPIFGKIIYDYIEKLITIRELCTTYNTMEKIKKNNNLWTIYSSNKKSI